MIQFHILILYKPSIEIGPGPSPTILFIYVFFAHEANLTFLKNIIWVFGQVVIPFSKNLTSLWGYRFAGSSCQFRHNKSATCSSLLKKKKILYLTVNWFTPIYSVKQSKQSVFASQSLRYSDPCKLSLLSFSL